MKIYTKTGDTGETSTLGNKRVMKSSLIIETVGDLDELNSVLGITKFYVNNPDTRELIINLQNWIFKISTFVITQGEQKNKYAKLDFEAILETMEKNIDKTEKHLGALKNFILPGGGEGAGWLHFSRAVCRRAERSLVKLYEKEQDEELLKPIKLLNRMSDLLFVLARYENFISGIPETIVK